MHLYRCYNAAMATTAATSGVSTGTSIKTMLQLSPPSTRQMKVVSWGYTIDTAQSALGTVELIQTDVAATVTAHVAAGVQPLDPNAPASLLTLGTANTGYTASAEGSITATRLLDCVKLGGGSAANPGMVYNRLFMPNEQTIIAVSKFLRVRATMGTSATMTCWIVWDE